MNELERRKEGRRRDLANLAKEEAVVLEAPPPLSLDDYIRKEGGKEGRIEGLKEGRKGKEGKD